MTDETENLVLELLRGMQTDMTEVRDRLSRVESDVAETKTGLRTLASNTASDFLAIQAKVEQEHRQTRDQVVGLRRAVLEYHSAVIGHGVLISDMDARLRRVEEHLHLPPLDVH